MLHERRKFDLSDKFSAMGQALITEGSFLQDSSIVQSGNTLILLAGLILSDEDMSLFAEFGAMFSTKQLIDSAKDDKDIDILTDIFRNRIKLKTLLPKRPKTNDDIGSEDK